MMVMVNGRVDGFKLFSYGPLFFFLNAFLQAKEMWFYPIYISSDESSSSRYFIFYYLEKETIAVHFIDL